MFVDYNQNAKDRTVASAYSVRPTPDARVSAPIAWDELTSCCPEDFTLSTMPARFARIGDRHAGIDDQPGSLDSLLELSTPVLQVRERLLILPIIGVLDAQRANQLTEQLLLGIRSHRAKVVVIDITGVPDVDDAVANSLVRNVEASRLMGADVIITGLSAKIAQILVTIGVDLNKMHTVGDLQGGIEEAERRLGFRVTRTSDERP